MHADDRLLAEAFRCGGVAYVLKQSVGEDLIHAVEQVLAGHKYVTPLIASEWVQDLASRIDQTQKLALTPRQREVLQLIIEGCTMKEIACRLGISARTAELVQYALKLGLTRT